MDLIIVESPTKAKTIARFVGNKFAVESSFGHIRDLPNREIGVDVDHDFTPKYVIPAKSRPVVKKLKSLAKKADQIILATDEDREGEAIAWHLAAALDLSEKQQHRIVFHEITAQAIQAALTKPRALDLALVDAQQARRILDRLVGYKLSPFLWKKVAKGLSAGRVQSVAVRLIVEREREIQKFQTEEYWTIEADLSRLDQGPISESEAKNQFTAKLFSLDGKILEQFSFKDEKAAHTVLTRLAGVSYEVLTVARKESKKNPAAPFTTSTLQQTANRWFGFTARETMVLAQQLYEKGHITYMRTDSFFLAEKFLQAAHAFLDKNLGADYALIEPRHWRTKAKGAQEAHEAIRPTEIDRAPEQMADELDKKQLKLYQLIWQRALASQMPPAVIDATAVDIAAGDTSALFRANGQVLKFDGYLKIYPEKALEVELPTLKKGEKLELHALRPEQHFTKPPARYSDAGLVKAMERFGIGRPSTYAPTIATIIARNYIARDDHKRLGPTEIAFIVNDLLLAHFPNIVDYQFTARLEESLDQIAAGEKNWQPVIKDFYEPFAANLAEKTEAVKKDDIVPLETSKEVCDKCGAPMIVKFGRYGKFLACSAFPDCKNIKPLNPGATDGAANEEFKKLTEKYAQEICDQCGAPMILKNGKFGPFLACSAYPKCRRIKNIAENKTSTGLKCPACGQGEIVQKRSRRGIFYACDRYPDCKNAYWSKPTGEACPQCGAWLVAGKNDTVVCSNKDCGYKKTA